MPKGGQNLPKKEKFVCHGHRIYRTATKIYRNMSVHSTTYAAQMFHQLGPLPPSWGINPQKKGKRLAICNAHYCQIPLVFLFIGGGGDKITAELNSVSPLSELFPTVTDDIFTDLCRSPLAFSLTYLCQYRPLAIT